MKLELYLQQWWGIQNFGRGNFTAYARVLELWDRHCHIADNAGWNQAESKKGFLVKPPKFAARFPVYIDRQAVGALHGLHWKSWPKRKSGEERNCATTMDRVNASVNSRAMTISIAGTWTLWRSHMRFWGTSLAKINCKDMTAAHEKQVQPQHIMMFKVQKASSICFWFLPSPDVCPWALKTCLGKQFGPQCKQVSGSESESITLALKAMKITLALFALSAAVKFRVPPTADDEWWRPYTDVNPLFDTSWCYVSAKNHAVAHTNM